jgi:hypothetical protein
MTVTVRINTDTPAGMRLVNEMKLHPESVQFIDPVLENTSSIPEGYVSLKEGFDEVREHVTTYTAAESAKLAFDRLGEKYNCKFDNKYTR